MKLSGLGDRFLAARRIPLLQAVKTSLATIGAWLLAAVLVQGQLPVFAAIAALLVVQPSVNQSVAKAIERCLGVILGVLIATGMSLLFGTAAPIILLTIVFAILLSWALRITAGSANQVAISAMLVLALGATSPSYSLDRVFETFIGAAVGLVVNLVVVPPVLLPPAREAVRSLGDEIAAALERLAVSLVAERTRAQLDGMMIEARLLRPMLAKAQGAIEEAEESLSFNPLRRRRRGELDELAALVIRLTPVVSQVVGMTRALHDHHDETLRDEPTAGAIAEQLRRAAHDARLLVGSQHDSIPDDEEPALTSQLVIARPQSTHWVLIGSLMEDLRRMHEELTE